jgi:molybdenum cofactor cytidylyltransferase
LFENIMRQRLDRLGASAGFVLSCNEEATLARSLQHLLRARPTCILIASTTAPAGPEDVVDEPCSKRAARSSGFSPVEPGNLLLHGYKDEIPVVSSPG